jgi:hypothetical protein
MPSVRLRAVWRHLWLKACVQLQLKAKVQLQLKAKVQLQLKAKVQLQLETCVRSTSQAMVVLPGCTGCWW